MDLTENVKQVNKKWKSLIESVDSEGNDLGFKKIEDSYRKKVTARLLENTEKVLAETTNNTKGMDIADPVLINLVRRTVPNLLAYDLVGVQPMTGPTGLVFAMRAHRGAQPVGPFGRPGDARTGNQTGSTVDGQGDTPAQQWGEDGKATDEAFYDEAVTTFSGTGSQTSNATAPNYSAYSVGTGMTTFAGEVLGRGLTGDGVFGEMSFTIEKTAVEAKERALKAEYTHEIARDLKAVHGLDAEKELSGILSTEIVSEINREVVNTLRMVAKIAPGEAIYENGSIVLDSNGAPTLGIAGLFDVDANSDGRWAEEKYKSLLVKINKEANAIAKDTRRGKGNFIVCSSDVATILDLTGKMTYAPELVSNLTVDDTGNTFVGTLQGKFKVYIDPYLGYDEVIVGYKGASEMDAGFFYCPYVPLEMFKATDPNTFQPKMAFKTRYGMVANPFTTMKRNLNHYYRKFKVQGI